MGSILQFGRIVFGRSNPCDAPSLPHNVSACRVCAYDRYNNLCWVLGQFIANGLLRGTQKLDNKWSYKIPLALQYLWVIPLFLVATFAPESPWWLVKKGRIPEAEKAVKQLQTKNDANDPAKTVALMVRTDQMEIDQEVGTSFLDCFRGVNLRRTEIACMAWSAQVLCGSWFGGGSAYFFQQVRTRLGGADFRPDFQQRHPLALV